MSTRGDEIRIPEPRKRYTFIYIDMTSILFRANLISHKIERVKINEHSIS